MNSLTRCGLLGGATAMLDAIIGSQVLSFIHQVGLGGKCGTWAATIDSAMIVLAVVAIPVGFLTARACHFFKAHLPAWMSFSIRMALCALLGLLLTYFIAIPVIARLV